MARSHFRDQSISQKNDSSSIGNKRGMARRAKKNSSHRDRQMLKKELDLLVKDNGAPSWDVQE